MKFPSRHSFSSPSRAAHVACGLLAFLLPLLLFLPTLRHGFIDLDDDTYVQRNAIVASGLSPSAVRAAFRPSSTAPMYIPVVWLSYMLDVSLFGLFPAAIHFGNSLCHAASSLLLFLLLLRLLRSGRSVRTIASPPAAPWTALLLALLWALHPLRVESVAWAAERKDVLAALFALLACHAWLSARNALQSSPPLPPSRFPAILHVFASLLFCAAGILSKPSLTPLPLLLLVLSLPPIAPRPSGRRLALCLAPFFTIAAVAAWLASQGHSALNAWTPPPLPIRIATIPSMLLFYLSKTLLPVHLALVYPVWTTPPAIGILLSLPFIAVALWIFRRRHFFPFLWLGATAAILFFLPVSGFVPVPFNLVADRFTYLPSIGLSIALLQLFHPCGTLDGTLEAAPPSFASHPRFAKFRIVYCAFCIVVAVLAVATAHHLPVWRDTPSVYAPVRRLLPDHHAVRTFDAWQCRLRGDFTAARECVRRAIAAGASDYSLFLSDVAAVNATDGPAAALPLLLANPPPVPSYRAHWAFFVSADQLALGDFPAVLRTAVAALASAPPSDKRLRPVLRAAMAAAFYSGNVPEATRWARLSGDLPPGREDLFLPDLLPYYVYLFSSDLSPLALPYFRRLAAECPRPDILNNLAWILATPLWSPAPPDYPVALAQVALDAIPPSHPALPSLLDTLSVALANAADFPAAADAVSRAIGLLPPGSPDLPAMQSRLDLYRQSLPYHERLGTPVPPSEYTFDPHL